MKKYVYLCICSLFSLTSYSQAEFDVLRMSQSDIMGTARYVSLSGAFNALGGDLSSISNNPAGIGIYRSSELSISPVIKGDFTETVMDGGSPDATEIRKFGLNNLGFVSSFKTFEGSPVSNLNFGFTWNRVADFNQTTLTYAFDRPVSLLDRIVQLENDNIPYQMHTSFFDYADGVHLIQSNSQGTAYETPLDLNETTNSSLLLEETGGINLYNISLGGDFSHQFYFGGALGIQNVHYERNSSYIEEYQLGGASELRNALKTTGAGIQFQLGMILRPDQNWRVGTSYYSGTAYYLTDVFQASMASQGFTDPSTGFDYTPDPVFVGSETTVDYIVQTPSKWTFGVAYLFGKNGLVSLDVDYLNNKNHTYKNDNGFIIDEVNDFFALDFAKTLNARLGAEWRVTEDFSLRAGGAYYGSPLVSGLEGLDIATPYVRPEFSMLRDTYYASYGVGYRSGPYYFDLAVQQKYVNENLFHFVDDSRYDDFAVVTRKKVNMVFSMGMKF